ncbi:MAG: MarR family transcriptional regulator [Acidimicrobiales bacterium]
MTHTSDPRFLVLHGLRLKGFAEPEALAQCVLVKPPEVEEHLRIMEAQELAQHRQGRISGWALLPAGREAHAAELALDLESAGCREAVEGCYRRFLEANADMLGVCTDWQMRPDGMEPVPNDHSDPAYDAVIIERLEAIDDKIQPACAELAQVLERFSTYGPRLARALARVQAGEAEWFTRPLMDSYHTVWFELHEDLLATLGIERSREEVPA